jgi:hypothetical protein
LVQHDLGDLAGAIHGYPTPLLHGERMIDRFDFHERAVADRQCLEHRF